MYGPDLCTDAQIDNGTTLSLLKNKAPEARGFQFAIFKN